MCLVLSVGWALGRRAIGLPDKSHVSDLRDGNPPVVYQRARNPKQHCMGHCSLVSLQYIQFVVGLHGFILLQYPTMASAHTNGPFWQKNKIRKPVGGQNEGMARRDPKPSKRTRTWATGWFCTFSLAPCAWRRQAVRPSAPWIQAREPGAEKGGRFPYTCGAGVLFMFGEAKYPGILQRTASYTAS